MTEKSRLWTSRSDRKHETPFRSGISRAMDQAFPLIVDDVMSERMRVAIQSLADRDVITSEDQRAGSAR